MHHPLNTVGETGLKFFAEISASISHDLKNVLGIINENAGLLEDFCLMADRGVELNPERLKKMSVSVKRQISRADAMIKDMNRFAHSVDAVFRRVALAEMIELLLGLTGRLSARRGVTVIPVLPQHAVEVGTSPYFLMNLAWRCLDFAMDAAGAPKAVELALEDAHGHACLRFGRLDGLTQAMLESFPGEAEQSLLDLLGAELTGRVAQAEMVLKLKTGAGNR
jgi:signal transduction histidine kinase